MKTTTMSRKFNFIFIGLLKKHKYGGIMPLSLLETVKYDHTCLLRKYYTNYTHHCTRV